jgi:hypothetical protein
VIRVLHLVHAFQTGGAERVILDLTLHSSPKIVNHVCSLCEPDDLVSQLDLTTTGFECFKKQPGNELRIVRASRLWMPICNLHTTRDTPLPS